MPVSSNVRRIFRTLIKDPGNVDVMMILADALEECGCDWLALVYRWAALNNKWPYRRRVRSGRERRGRPDTYKVYDWDSEGRMNNPWPERSWLPREVHRVLCAPSRRRYSGIHRAFLMLVEGFQKAQKQGFRLTEGFKVAGL